MTWMARRLTERMLTRDKRMNRTPCDERGQDKSESAAAGY